MNSPSQHTMFWRLGLAIILTQLVVLVALGTFGFFRIRQFHHAQTQWELSRAMPLMAAQFEDRVGRDDEAAIDRDIKRLGEATGWRMTIMMPDGRIIADSSADPARMEDHRFRPEISTAIEQGDGSSVRFSATLGVPMMYFARAVNGPDGPLRFVMRMAIPMDRINADFIRVAQVIGLFGLLSMVMTCLIILLIARHFSRQVRTLADGAARFASGQFGHQIPLPPSSDLSSLAVAINDMAQTLGGKIRQLDIQKHEQNAILQSMSNGVIAIDLQQRLLMVNRAATELFGLEGVDLDHRLLQEVIREARLHHFITDALNRRDACRAEFPLETRPGITVHVISESLSDADGKPDGLLLVLDDVSESRRYESMRSDFAANVSHELRTPITSIKGYVETLLEYGTDDPEQTRRFLDIIRKNSSRLASIVEDVMSLSKLEQTGSGSQLERQPVDLRELCAEVAGSFESAAGEKGITIECSVPGDLTIDAHAQLLNQAVGNLVSNAVNYSPRDTGVRIEGRGGEKEVTITVTDQGPGIDPVHHARLFERFYRVDKARSRNVGGTGLGLALVKHIAMIHGGSVKVDSTPGKGSTFTITLPRGS